MNLWSNSDIEAILIQLQDRDLLFPYCEFAVENGRLCLLGKGANANVYRAVHRDNAKQRFAIKVIGFGDRCVRSEDFYSSVLFQMEAWKKYDKVVQVYAIKELSVRLESDHNVITATTLSLPMMDEKDELEEGALHLQFILMEEVTPVLWGANMGSPSLFPRRLACFEEEEILHLAYDVAIALEAVHKEKMIHRDVKLENIFYDPQEKTYKLGDFGIARIMENGMASTVAFTKGYGAPEVVGTMGDEYDCTADIYSLGMVLYVLLNGLRFPGSQNYHPNAAQYMSGFTPEYPAGGTDAFREVVMKMIQFNPDDRYQSMREVLNEIGGLRYGKRVQFQQEHKWASLTLGLLFGVSGILWKAGEFATNRFGLDLPVPFDNFKWVVRLLTSLSIALLFYHFLLRQRITVITKLCLENNGYWLMVASVYALIAMWGIIVRDILPTGLCGMAFCAIWVCRESLLLWIDRHKGSPDV